MLGSKKILYIHGAASHGNDSISKYLKAEISENVLSPTFSPNYKESTDQIKKLLKRDWDVVIAFSFGTVLLRESIKKKNETPVILINPLFENIKFLNENRKVPDFSKNPPVPYKVTKEDRKLVRDVLFKKLKIKRPHLVYSKHDEVTDYSKIPVKVKRKFISIVELEEKHNIKNLVFLKSIIDNI